MKAEDSLKIILSVAVLILCIYVEDYFIRGFPVILGGCLCLVGMVLEEIPERNNWAKKYSFCTILGVIIYLTSFFTLGFNIHFVETNDGNIIVKSPFYTHQIDEGLRFDTDTMRTYYKQYHSKIEVAKEKRYFLYKDSICSVYSMSEKILDVPIEFQIKSRDLGKGVIDYIDCGTKQYDLRGILITPDYQPLVVDYTPDYSNINL